MNNNLNIIQDGKLVHSFNPYSFYLQKQNGRSEEQSLREIFGENILWKGKYIIDYCDLCDCFCIQCPDCNNVSCNGSSCEKCHEDSVDWSKNVKHRIVEYLAKEEIPIYDKCRRLKIHMGESLNDGEYEINFEKLREDGKLSQWEEDLFEKLLK